MYKRRSIAALPQSVIYVAGTPVGRHDVTDQSSLPADLPAYRSRDPNRVCAHLMR